MATKQKQRQEEALLILEFFSQSVPVLHHARKPEKQWRLEGLSFRRSLLYEIQLDSPHSELLSGTGGSGVCLWDPSSVPGLHWVRGLGTTNGHVRIITELGLRNLQAKWTKKMSLFSASSLNANFHSGSDSLTLPSFLYSTTLILF